MPRADESISGVFPLKDTVNDQTRRQLGWHVFHRMNGKIDPLFSKRLFNFLREKPFAANFRQAPFFHLVAGCAHRHDLHLRRVKAMGVDKGGGDHARLNES